MPDMWSVAVVTPPFSTYSYLEPSYLPASVWRPGCRVVVPMGRSLRMAVLLDPDRHGAPPPEGVELKEMLWPVDRESLLSTLYLDMIQDLATRQMAEPGRILGSVLPAGLRTVAFHYLAHFGGESRTIRPHALAAMKEAERREYAQAWLDGHMVAKPKRGEAGKEICCLAKDPPWPVRPAATMQTALLEFLWDKGEVARSDLIKALGPSSRNALARLVDQGLVSLGAPSRWAEEETGACGDLDSVWDAEQGRAFELNPEQETALSSLAQALDDPEPQTRLLHGVTGSGKTVVYLELAKGCLNSGRSAFLLAPEVALGLQLHKAATCFFGPEAEARIILYHGYMPPARREEIFQAVARKQEPVLVIGTRSALFLPVADPALVILDEEHDSSFKQDERLVYQAKEIAYFLVGKSKGLLVLGSATPDIRTKHASREGFVPALRLRERVGGGELPEVRLVDIKQYTPTEHLLTPAMVEMLSQTVTRGDQAIIMLNRRGYSPLMYCLDCGLTASCPECEIGLTYHKNRERLVCHYCGKSIPFPVFCPGCGGCNYLPMGEGTEKLEETLIEKLPRDTAILRLDRDSTRRPGRMEAILKSFARGEARVLIGTQMLSKGHHFPDVTQVVVADGDLGLNLPDYRATERTFQLLVQVAGRAGRGSKPGTVWIQTRDVNQPCWSYVRTHDYEGFFENELERRRIRNYPPFIKLALIRINFPMQWDEGMAHVQELARVGQRAAQRSNVLFLGPAPAPIGLLRGRKRFNCLLKAGDWPGIRSVFHAVRNLFPRHPQLRLSLDLDPVDMM